MAVCPGPAMIGTVLSVLVLYGVALLVLSVYGGTGAGHSPRLGRQVGFLRFGEVGISGPSAPTLVSAPPYTVQPTLLTLCAVIFDRSTPNLPESGHTAMPWCPPEQHTTRLRRAGKSRPVDAVQLQQTFASPEPLVYPSTPVPLYPSTPLPLYPFTLLPLYPSTLLSLVCFLPHNP